MKKLIPVFFAIALFAGCQKDPDLSDLSSEYLVFTNYDNKVNFSSFSTFYIPDSILVITDKKEPEYWVDNDAETVLDAFITNMENAGYRRTNEKDEADLGLQISYIKNINYFVNYNNPYWWWDYPGYWNSWYWGSWGGGWYYPYPVVYSYSVGSLLAEMLNLKAQEGERQKLPVIWDAYMSGLLYDYNKVNIQLTVNGVNQAFSQSPYLKK